MKILIIEDSEYKIESLRALVSEFDFIASCAVAKSFQSGIKFLEDVQPDLVLLDMTLPTSEKNSGQTDGRTRLYGGKELLVEMEFLSIKPKVIVVTQFDHFGEPPNSVDLNTLLNQLKSQFEDMVIGGVYYDNVNSVWRDELRSLLLEHFSDPR